MRAALLPASYKRCPADSGGGGAPVRALVLLDVGLPEGGEGLEDVGDLIRARDAEVGVGDARVRS